MYLDLRRALNALLERARHVSVKEDLGGLCSWEPLAVGDVVRRCCSGVAVAELGCLSRHSGGAKEYEGTTLAITVKV